MSDPVTNIEIEDVLSSIRRLVSEGEKARTAPNPVPAAVPDHSDKLVLTPALRVASTSSDSQDTASDAPAQDTQDALPEDWPTSGFDWRDDKDNADDTAHDAPEDTASTVDRSALEEKIAALEAAVTSQPDDWEPDGSETKTTPEWPAEVYSALADVEDAEEVDTAVDIPDGDMRLSEYDAVGGRDDDSDGARIAFQHLADPNDAFGDDLIGGALPSDVTEDETLSAYLRDESVMDEDALRDLVLEIVRQELQGKLGERITRNVRKLVRREIMRVLNAQDID